MYYEIMSKKLCTHKAECVFCKKPVSWSDYAYLCKEHGKVYYTLPKVLRIILPKFLIYWYILRTIRQQPLCGLPEGSPKPASQASHSGKRCTQLGISGTAFNK